MRRTADLPLHDGRAPRWLFARMQRLAGAILEVIVRDFGPEEVLTRLADPVWLQALGCVLGFDWHSSGLTTVTCGALKAALEARRNDLGVYLAGGKGAVSRRTPDEVRRACERTGDDADRLVRASRLAAKVDSAAVQDGYQIYCHFFAFAPGGRWCVVQQGMNEQTRYARRYHWLGDANTDFTSDPHAGLASPELLAGPITLNAVAGEAEQNRQACVQLALWPAERLRREIGPAAPVLFPQRHAIDADDVDWRRLEAITTAARERGVASFEALLGIPGLGARTLRSLALIAQVIYDAPVSRRDPAVPGPDGCRPATFSYAHGGKDGHPFPVDRHTYDRSIAWLEQWLRSCRVAPSEKDEALRRLARWTSPQRR